MTWINYFDTLTIGLTLGFTAGAICGAIGVFAMIL